MSNPSPYVRRNLELRAAEYYASIRKPEQEWQSITDLTSQLAEFGHRIGAGEYEHACQVLYSIDSDYLFRWGYYDRLVLMHEKLLDHLADPYWQATNLGYLGNAHLGLGHSVQAIDLYENALKIAREANDRQNEAIWLGRLGLVHRDIGKARVAVNFIEAALAIDREIAGGASEGEGWHLGYLGSAFRDLGQIEDARKCYQESLEIAQKSGKRWMEESRLSDLGNINRDLGLIQEAMTHYEKALEIARELHNRRDEAVCIGRLGTTYQMLGQTEQAEVAYQEAINIVREIGHQRREGRYLGSLGLISRVKGQIERAISYHEEALVLAKKTGDYWGEGTRLENLGDIYRDLGHTKQARTLYEQALTIFREVGDPRRESIQLSELGKLLLMTGEYAQAEQCFIKALDLAVPTVNYMAALGLGLVYLLNHNDSASAVFEKTAGYCWELLDKTQGLYQIQYALALAFVGQAVCDPRCTDVAQRTDLLAPALAEYRRALDIISVPGVVCDALRDLELIRAAGVEGLEPVFELLEGTLNE